MICNLDLKNPIQSREIPYPINSHNQTQIPQIDKKQKKNKLNS